MTLDPQFAAHLATGATTTCRAWRVTRADGVALGFTDHDRDLSFDGTLFRADTGLSAMALEQATGLSVDNTEALGALSDAAIREVDIEAGRYDGAQVEAWWLNWADPAQRQVVFRGHLGEITRDGTAFRAELRGLSDLLNRPVGRVYQAPCSAVLGDADCGFDTTTTGYVWEGAITAIDGTTLMLPDLPDFQPGWFERGRVTFLGGTAGGLTSLVKRDGAVPGARHITLWQAPPGGLAAGDGLRLVAGCDKRFETCRLKFNNALNFRGFPDIPSEDWIAVHPATSPEKSGGSRR